MWVLPKEGWTELRGRWPRASARKFDDKGVRQVSVRAKTVGEEKTIILGVATRFDLKKLEIIDNNGPSWSTLTSTSDPAGNAAKLPKVIER